LRNHKIYLPSLQSLAAKAASRGCEFLTSPSLPLKHFLPPEVVLHPVQQGKPVLAMGAFEMSPHRLRVSGYKIGCQAKTERSFSVAANKVFEEEGEGYGENPA
jgi:hypothetical protein